MTFVTAGLAVAGLAGIAIPIIIHLLSRQRRRPIRWAAMRFLLEAYRKHRRRLRIEQLLLLAVRCLIIAVLGLALARPILEAAGLVDLGGARSVYLVVDTGLASSVTIDGAGTALDRHLDEAERIIDALEPGDFVGVITAGAPSRGLIVPPSTDHGGVLAALRELEPSQSATDVAGALSLLASALEQREAEQEATLVYLLSEFRAGSANLEDPLPAALDALGESVTLLAAAPATEPLANTQIVAVDPVRTVVLPGLAEDGSGQVTVRLARHGGDLGPQVSRVRLAGDDVALVDPKEVSWKPGQVEAEVEFVLTFESRGERQLAIRASIDDDRLAADNRRAEVLESRDHIRALLVDRRSFGFEPSVDRLTAGQWIIRALEPVDDGPIQIIEVDPAALDAPDLRRSDVAVVPRPDLLNDGGWGHLRRFVDRGGLLLIAPPGEIQVHQWVDHLAEDLGLAWRVDREVTEHPDLLELDDEHSGGPILRMLSSELAPLTQNVGALRALHVDASQTEARAVLQFSGGAPALIVGSPRRPSEDDVPPSEGLVAYLTFAPQLSWTNLPTRPLMVPLFHELIRQGLSEVRRTHRAAVGSTALGGLPRATVALLDDEGRRLEADVAGRLREPIPRSGLWRAVDAAGQDLAVIAVNVDPAHGRTGVQSPEAVTAWLSEAGPWSLADQNDLTGILEDAQAGSPIGRTLLLALLGLVIVETLLARWFSHAFQSTAEGLSAETGRLAVGGLR